MALVALAALLHYTNRCAHRLQMARKRGLWLDAPHGPTLALSPDASLEAQAAPLLNLDDLDRHHPQRFYLPEASYEQLADCYAMVGGVRLPLHAQVLAARAAVLRQMFVAQAEDGQPACSYQEPAALTAAFAGCGLREVAAFLRFTYSPDQATPASLRHVHKYADRLLDAVAGLAHRLDAGGLLDKIEAYLSAASAKASMRELIATLQLAERCHMAALADTCLSLLARKLAASGPFWREQVSHAQLAECNSDSLAALACKMAAQVRAGAFEPPPVHGVLHGHKGTAGGFTWVITSFSKQQGRVTSPWVEVGGVQWRLKVWPKGDDAAGGGHLSAYLECNYAHAQSLGMSSIEAFYDFTFIDQSEEGLHFTVDCGKDLFTANTQNWGKTRMVSLEELARPDRQYLDQDRLAVRIAIRVMPPEGSAGTAGALPLPAAPPPAAPAVPAVAGG